MRQHLKMLAHSTVAMASRPEGKGSVPVDTHANASLSNHISNARRVRYIRICTDQQVVPIGKRTRALLRCFDMCFVT